MVKEQNGRFLYMSVRFAKPDSGISIPDEYTSAVSCWWNSAEGREIGNRFIAKGAAQNSANA